MKKYRLLSALILASCLTASTGYGQPPAYQPTYPPPAPIAPHGDAEKSSETYTPAGGGLSDWILNRRECCEGQPGKRTPLYTELYINAGPSFPIGRGNSDLAHELETGWSMTGGARALFFNEPLTRAWVIDLHVINTNEGGGHHNQGFPLTVYHNGTKLVYGSNGLGLATLHNYNRTMAGVGFGRDWYLWKCADIDACNWRVGADAGGRYGTQTLSLDQVGHVNSVVGGAYAAAHMDVEVPWKAIVFFAGGRLEWAYSNSSILQANSGAVQDLNLLLNVGIRY